MRTSKNRVAIEAMAEKAGGWPADIVIDAAFWLGCRPMASAGLRHWLAPYGQLLAWTAPVSREHK
jgi:hypothetical protein